MNPEQPVSKATSVLRNVAVTNVCDITSCGWDWQLKPGLCIGNYDI